MARRALLILILAAIAGAVATFLAVSPANTGAMRGTCSEPLPAGRTCLSGNVDSNEIGELVVIGQSDWPYQDLELRSAPGTVSLIADFEPDDLPEGQIVGLGDGDTFALELDEGEYTVCFKSNGLSCGRFDVSESLDITVNSRGPTVKQD